MVEMACQPEECIATLMFSFINSIFVGVILYCLDYERVMGGKNMFYLFPITFPNLNASKTLH